MPRRVVKPRGAHKSTGGMLPMIPAPVDPVGAANDLTTNTVASTRLAFARRLRMTLGVMQRFPSGRP